MKAYDATSVIQAAPATIWAILTDAPGYPKWDSGVLRVDGYGVVRPGRASNLLAVDDAVEVIVLGLPVIELVRFPAPRSWR